MIKKTYESFEDFISAIKRSQVDEIFYSFIPKSEPVQMQHNIGTKEYPEQISVSGYNLYYIVAMSCVFSKDIVGFYYETTQPQAIKNQAEADTCLEGVKKALEGVKSDINKECPSVSVISGGIQVSESKGE